MALTDTLIQQEEDSRELVQPRQRMNAPMSRRGRDFIDLTPDAEDQLRQLRSQFRPRQTAAPAMDAPAEKPLGLMGTIREGARGTLRALGAAADTMQGDAQGVVQAAQEQAQAPKDPDLERFYAHIEERKNALGNDPSLWEGIKAVGGAAIDNPRGFGLMIAEQLPNSGAALGAGAAGALAGSFAGPVGAAVGGLAGLATANIGLETGHKALEAAADMEFSPDEQSQVRREGLIKGGVITGIDAATLGLTNFVAGTTRRAVERATVKTMMDHGVDVASAAARRAAMETPDIATAVRTAQELAEKGARRLGSRLAQTGGAVALETVGEGAGEYLGELAATGKANAVDAVVEGFAGLGTSIGEITATSALNRRALKRLLDSPDEAQKTAESETTATGVEHEVIPSPTEPDKFVAVPKTRTVSGIRLERDAEGNLKPVQPKSTQTDFNLANRQGFELTTEDKLRQLELERRREEELAKNPIISPTIAGKPVTRLPTEALNYTVARGSTRSREIAVKELERRKQEGHIDIPEKPADMVKRIVATGAEKAREQALTANISPPVSVGIDPGIPQALANRLDSRPQNGADSFKTKTLGAQGQNITKINPDRRGNEKTVFSKDSENSSRAGVKALSNLATIEPFKKQGFNGLNSDARAAMTQSMLSIGHDDKVLKSIIKFIPIDVVNMLRRKKFTPEMLFHNPSMLTNSESVLISNFPVSANVDIATAIIKATAAYAAKGEPALGSFKSGGITMERGAAAGTIDNRHDITPNSSVVTGTPDAPTSGVPPIIPKTNKPLPVASSQGVRKLVSDLIKRRAASKESGKERSVNNAINRAKEVMDGKRNDHTLESKWFRTQAAAMRKADAETAEILSRIGEAIAKQPANNERAESQKDQPVKKDTPKLSRSRKQRATSPLTNRVRSVVDAVTKKWKNAPEVVVLDSMEDAPQAARTENERQQSLGATGNPEGFVHGGKVYIVATEMNHPGDVLRVLMHESLGHFGLRGVFGQDLNKILAQVASLRKKDVEVKARQYGLDMRKESDRLIAAEEILAEMAETNPKNNLVQRAIAAIRTWLRNNIPGFENLKLSDEEIIQSFLEPSRQFVQQRQAKTRLETSAVAFSRSTAFAADARDRFEKITDSFIYNFQDRFKPLKDIQREAGPVSEDADAALAEERYSGIVRSRLDTFTDQMRDPLLKAIHDSGVAYEDVEKHLHALHAPSRNAAMREINPTKPELDAQLSTLEKQRDTLAKDADVKRFLQLRRDLRQAEADIEDGIADESLARVLQNNITQIRRQQNVKDYATTLDKLKALRLVKPFEGDNTALSGMSNREAAAILAKADKDGTRAKLDKVSGIVNAITARTREIYAESGLEKADTIEAWNRKYENYVPLHRDEVSGQTMPKVGQGFNIRGRESKRATGSSKEVTDILAHVVAQHEAAIIRSEKARVDRALFQFASTHPDTSLWTLDNAPKIRTVDPVSGFVVEHVDPTYKNRPEVLTLKIDGEEHTITFNEQNQQAMRLAASMKNMTAQELGEVTQMIGRFTRFLATMNTTANPVFVARNFMRDLQTAYVNLSDTAIADKKREVFGNIPAAIKGMWNLSRGKPNSRWAKYAQEFKDAGGQTGWMEHYNNIGERADALKKELSRMEPGKLNTSRRAFRSLWTLVEDANNAVENGARLASFVAARKAGISAAKAASLAKNLTVNFNAKGAKSTELNMWYMFMNASIQGTARLMKAMSNRQVRRIVAGVVLSGFLMDIMARAMAGDDDEDGENDYDQLPEHTKAMNFVFMVGGQPVTIPMPYGYNFFASTGRKVSEMMFRENYSAARSAVDLAAVFADAFSPVGQAGSGLQFAAPTVADPFIQWAENKNFAGNPLRKDQSSFGVPKPEYQMGFKSTSAPAKWMAETLNVASGGNEVRPGFVDVNPAFFDFAVSSIIGGAGRTYTQLVSGPQKALGDDEIQAREVPFFNIFVGARPEYQTERKYFAAVRSVELAKKEYSTYQQKGDREMVRQIREDYRGQLRLKAAAKSTQRILSNLRRRDLALDKTDPPNKRELRRQLEEKKKEVMSRFNRLYAEATATP